MNLFQRVIFVLSSVLAMSLSPAQAASVDKPLEVIVFPGGFNWPIFAAEGLAVNVTPTPDSKYQMVNFIDGKFDIAMTAMDNVVAYAEGQGAAPTQAQPDIIAFMGSDNALIPSDQRHDRRFSSLGRCSGSQDGGRPERQAGRSRRTDHRLCFCVA